MHISRIKLKNWRNFREAEVSGLGETVYLIGPNASGKSNLLDAIRFLRDIAKTKGGGIQGAIESRGGIKKIRCLHARKETEILIEIDLSQADGALLWTYSLEFNLPRSGSREPLVRKEYIVKYGGEEPERIALDRPDEGDVADPDRLRQTHIEQINTNRDFRDLTLFLAEISYVHLVPQLLKFGDLIGGRVVEDDPFGQEFMLRISRAQPRTRTARLSRIEKALQVVVPQLSNLTFLNDEVTGHPHLEMRFKHHRPHGARQREDQFSDGTLRLISLLWLLQEGGESPLLLEEPELSLNEEIVREIPEIVTAIRRKNRTFKQVFISTHSSALLSNSGIDANGIVVLIPSLEGSTVRKADRAEEDALSAGLSPAEVILPNSRKIANRDQLFFEL